MKMIDLIHFKMKSADKMIIIFILMNAGIICFTSFHSNLALLRPKFITAIYNNVGLH